MITIISGTNRPGSSIRKVTVNIESIYSAPNILVQVPDLMKLPPEIILPSAYEHKPADFRGFAEKVLMADGLVLVMPEYNGGIHGILKYFIDMLPFPESLEHRPVCFVGVAARIWGVLRPVEHLQAIFGYRNAYIYAERVSMPGIHKLLNESGQSKEPDIKARLEKRAIGFIDFLETLRLKKFRYR